MQIDEAGNGNSHPTTTISRIANVKSSALRDILDNHDTLDHFNKRLVDDVLQTLFGRDSGVMDDVAEVGDEPWTTLSLDGSITGRTSAPLVPHQIAT